MEWKDNMPSLAEGFFLKKQTTWKERIKKGQTDKEQRRKDWFIQSLVDLPVKPWQCESTCRSFAFLDSVLIRDRRAITSRLPSQRQYTISAQHCIEQHPQRVTPFSLGTHNLNDTAWSTMAVTLSASSERYLSHPT